MINFVFRLRWFDYIALVLIVVNVLLRLVIEPGLSRFVGIDSYFYDESAINLAVGKGYSHTVKGVWQPVFGVTPGYSLFLSVFYSLLPLDEPLSDSAVRVLVVVVVQNILSIATYVLIYRVIAYRFNRPDVGIIFLGLIVFYVPFIIASYKIGVETLALFIFSVLLTLVFSRKLSRKRLGQVLIGLLAGYLVLVKPYFIYVLPTIMIWKWVLNPKMRGVVFRETIVMGISMGFVLGLWIGRTYLSNQMFVPIQAGIGWVSETGSCPDDLCDSAVEPAVDQNVPEQKEEQQYVAEVERNYFKVSDNPYLRLFWWYVIKKPRDHLGATFEQNGITKIEPPALREQVALAMERYHIWIMGLSLVGALAIIKRREAEWKLLVYWNLFGLITHSAFWVLPRYAMAMVMLMMMTASFGLVEMVKVFLNKDVWHNFMSGLRGFSPGWKVYTLALIGLLGVELAWVFGWEGFGLDTRRVFSLIFWCGVLVLLAKFLLAQPFVSRFQLILRIAVILFIWGRVIAFWPRFWDYTVESFTPESQVFPVVLRNGKVLIN